MRNVRLIIACLFSIMLTATISSAQIDPLKDEFGNVNCEDEMAHLDNFAIQLQNSPGTLGYVIVYGGRYGRHSEALARASRIKAYLVENRGLDANRIVKINGGYRESLNVELWVFPHDASAPPLTPTLQLKDVKFKKGKIKKWEYRQCGLGY